MGDAAASSATFRVALANLDAPKPPAWWYGAFYYTPLRDLAGVLAVGADTGHPEGSAPLLERIANLHPDPERLNTQEKAWLLMASHSFLKQGTKRTLSVNGAAARGRVAAIRAVSLGRGGRPRHERPPGTPWRPGSST